MGLLFAMISIHISPVGDMMWGWMFIPVSDLALSIHAPVQDVKECFNSRTYVKV